MQLDQLTVDGYLEALASAAATPGGGAAAGLTGAQAAALLAMAGNLSRGKRFEGVAEQIEEIVRFCDGARERFSALMVEDAAAFEALMAALRAPKSNDAEAAAREKLVQECLQSAASVPLAMMKETIRLTTPASILANIGNPQLISDVAVALQLIEAALHSARLNVLINLRQIRDPGFVDNTGTEIAALLEQFREEKRVCALAIEQAMPGAGTQT